MKRLLFCSLLGVTVAVYAIMVGWSLPVISAAAGGMAPFDMRPGGYTFDEAKEFLSALSPEGAAFYRDVQHSLDILYPLLIAATLFFALEALLPRRWGVWRWLAAFPVILVAMTDWAENAAVAGLLAAGPERITPELVAEASRWSVWKAGVSTVAFSAVLVALLWRAWLKLRQRRLPGV